VKYEGFKKRQKTHTQSPAKHNRLCSCSPCPG